MSRFHHRVLLLVIAAGALSSGCADIRPATTFEPLGTSSSLSRAEINGRSPRSAASLTLATGEVVDADALHIAQDLTTWFDPATGTLRTASTADVLAVRVTDRRSQTIRGAVIGAIAGGLVGLGVGALWESVEGGDAAAVGLIGGTAVGAGIGALLGHASSAPRPLPVPR